LGAYPFGTFDWHFDWFSILISRNWRSLQARSLIFDITLSTQNRVAHKVSKILPYRGRRNYFHYMEGLSFGCWHLDWFSTFILRNWRARQARGFHFGIMLTGKNDKTTRSAFGEEL